MLGGDWDSLTRTHPSLSVAENPTPLSDSCGSHYNRRPRSAGRMLIGAASPYYRGRDSVPRQN